MGLVLNPYAFRIGHVNSWSDSWYLISTEYVEFLHSSILLKSFVYYVLFKFYPTRFSYWLVSHIEILFFNNNMYIWLYLYEASGKYKITKYIKLFKYGLFKGYRLRTFWLKKKLFDKNPVALGIFNFIRLFGSHIERYDTVENYVFDDAIRQKIGSLRERYGYKWLGIEEIYVLRTALSMFLKSANRFALSRLSMIIKSLFFLPIMDGSLSLEKLRGPRIFLFFFSYFLLLLKQWPYYKSIAKFFSSKIIFVFLRQTVFYLFFNPFIKYLSKFIEYLCSFFGYSSIVRASIITNFSLSAFFIARYIMTAIRNGFNYWDILFPIRKTLGRFMQIKLFDNYVNKKTTLKTSHLNRGINYVNRRVNLVIFFVIFLKYKLFFDDFYKSLYSYDSYNKLFCFMQILNKKKLYNISNISSTFKVLHKSYVFKRFFNIFKKKLFEFIFHRITSEKVNEIKRLTKPPLTLLQKEKYNKRRRMKRWEKRSIIELTELRETYLKLNEEFFSRLSDIKTFSFSLKKGRRDLMIERKKSNSVSLRRFFSTNFKKKISKPKQIPIGLKFLIKLYIIFLFAKFFKVFRYRAKKLQLISLPKKRKKNVYMQKKKIARQQALLRFNNSLKKKKRLKLMYHLNKIFFLFKRKAYGLFSKSFTLLYYRINPKKTFEIFSITLPKFFLTRYLNRNVLKKKINIRFSNIKHIKRNYHSSNFSFDFIVNILRDLAKKEDSIDKRHLRISYKKILKDLYPTDHRNHYIKANNMPSVILTKAFKTFNNGDAAGCEKILNSINIIFYLVNHMSTLSSNNDILFNNSMIFIIIKFYEVLYYLLFLKLYGLNHYKINKLFLIIRQVFIMKFTSNNYNIYFLLIKALNRVKSNVIKFIGLHCISSNYLKKKRLVIFNFILKFIDFFSNKGLNGFSNYFLFLLNSIIANYKNINNLSNIYIKRILILIDEYWYYGFKNFKRYSSKNLSEFIDKFNLFFSIVVIVFKILFSKFQFNDSYFPTIYKLLLQLIPSQFKANWLIFHEDFFPYSFNSKFQLKLDKKYFRYSDLEYFKHYMFVNDDLNYIGKDNFYVFITRNCYRIFPIVINSYFFYVNSLVDSFDKAFSLHTKFVSNKLLSYSDKIVRVKARDHVKSFLYGFKFHFVGRFTRKQQSASMWFRQGFLPSSSMKAEVDYGIFTIPLRFSACTVKVWLYKGFYVPKRTFNYGKWL